ncbi:MAG: hypothetical protein BWX86_03007 [Verrucomicrobia bacterium ADurb.Bin122]|nr:MAG: hypothetical protein BWX86_03007 [Verrucomicrobia bacterium ADurb.Bin122]
MVKIERFDSEGIAGEEETARVDIPDRKSKHAAQPPDTTFAPLCIGGEQDLGVALRAENMARRLKLPAKLAEVVDGTVENERETPVRRAHRLSSVCGVEDGESAHAECCKAQVGYAGIVGSTMSHGFAHADDGRVARLRHRLGIDETGDAAHGI